MAIDETALTGSVHLTAEVRDEDGRTVVMLAGEIDIATAGTLREVLVLPEVLNAPSVRLDLTEVAFLGSPGIGLLVSACKRIRNAGGSFSMICKQGEAQRVLEISGLLEYLNVEDQARPARARF